MANNFQRTNQHTVFCSQEDGRVSNRVICLTTIRNSLEHCPNMLQYEHSHILFRQNSLITAIKRDLRCQTAPRGIATALIAVIGVALHKQSKSIRTIPCNSYICYISATGVSPGVVSIPPHPPPPGSYLAITATHSTPTWRMQHTHAYAWRTDIRNLSSIVQKRRPYTGIYRGRGPTA